MEERLKQDWETTKRVLNAEADIANNKKTSLDSLISRYRQLSIIAFLCISWAPLTWIKIVAGNGGPVWFAWFMAAILLISAIGDSYLCFTLKRIDIVNMSVDEVIRLVARSRKIHISMVCILLPTVLAAVIALCFSFTEDPYLLGAVILGAVVGLAIGLPTLRRFLSDYKNLIG